MSLLTPAEYRALMKNQPKYSNEKTPYGGRLYSSKAEASYAAELDLKIRAGIVDHWQAQVRYALHAFPSGARVGDYVADFVVVYTDGHEEVVDTKGFETQLFKWKRKHWEIEYSRKLILVKR